MNIFRSAYMGMYDEKMEAVYGKCSRNASGFKAEDSESTCNILSNTGYIDLEYCIFPMLYMMYQKRYGHTARYCLYCFVSCLDTTKLPAWLSYPLTGKWIFPCPWSITCRERYLTAELAHHQEPRYQAQRMMPVEHPYPELL